MPVDEKVVQALMETIPPAPANELCKELSKHFDKCGLFYRIFARCKSASSTIKKMRYKKYDESSRKMQDLLGVRIALYFKDDIDICVQILQKNYTILEIVRDEATSDTFKPMRLNIVCQMPDHISAQFVDELWSLPIDKTFEIQIRTIFSEGWHEVEHDLRYKNQKDWIDSDDLSRNLNGVLATLETCDWAILNVFDSLAYQKYKNKDWSAMLRNHLRIRIDDNQLNKEIANLFDQKHELAKDFFRVDRQKLLLLLSDKRMFAFPRRIDNIVYIINELIIKDPELQALTPTVLKDNLASL